MKQKRSNDIYRIKFITWKSESQYCHIVIRSAWSIYNFFQQFEIFILGILIYSSSFRGLIYWCIFLTKEEYKIFPLIFFILLLRIAIVHSNNQNEVKHIDAILSDVTYPKWRFTWTTSFFRSISSILFISSANIKLKVSVLILDVRAYLSTKSVSFKWWSYHPWYTSEKKKLCRHTEKVFATIICLMHQPFINRHKTELSIRSHQCRLNTYRTSFYSQ